MEFSLKHNKTTTIPCCVESLHLVERGYLWSKVSHTLSEGGTLRFELGVEINAKKLKSLQHNQTTTIPSCVERLVVLFIITDKVKTRRGGVRRC